MENIEEMKKAIRYNGLLLEQLQDHILQIHEGHEFMHENIKEIKERLSLSQMDVIPSLIQAVKALSKKVNNT